MLTLTSQGKGPMSRLQGLIRQKEERNSMIMEDYLPFARDFYLWKQGERKPYIMTRLISVKLILKDIILKSLQMLLFSHRHTD